jgi:uncharacterized protein YjbI with pentapeptide repeats
MQLKDNIEFPVPLSKFWNLTSDGKVIAPLYYEWPNGGPDPYAGGGGVMGWFDRGTGGGNSGTIGSNLLALWWVGPGQASFQAMDTLAVPTIAAGTSTVWELAQGRLPNHDWPGAHKSITPASTFNMVNLGGGNFALEQNGTYLTVNVYIENPDWNCYVICLPGNRTTIGPGQTITVSSAPSLFPILLITGSGVGLNLAGQDLAADNYINSIAGVDFTDAVLYNATLANLPNLSVAGCDFTNASVNGTIMTGVQNLNQATWSGANLWHTDLSQVDPAGTEGVDFSGAHLGQVVFSNGQPLASNYSYANAQFIGCDLQSTDLHNVSLVGANFTGASLWLANLDGADLTGADLTGADLTGASLAGTDLTGANLSGTKLNDTDLTTTIFDPTPAFGTSTATGTQFQGSTVPVPSLGMNWSYIDLTGATLTSIPQTLSGLVAQSTLFPSYLPFAGIVLQNVDFTDAQLYYANLTAADLGFATLDGALLKGARLSKANLSGATLIRAWLIAEGSNDPSIEDPSKYEAAVCSGAYLLNTVMDDVYAAGVDFASAKFATDPGLGPTQASATGAFMVRSTFSDTLAVRVDFTNTQFSGANFSDATLVASNFASCWLDPTSDEVKQPTIMHRADIRGTQFAQVAGGQITNPANMDGLDMSGARASTDAGVYKPDTYFDYYGKRVVIYVNYQATVLGNTTSMTTCPNGCPGPCSL